MKKIRITAAVFFICLGLFILWKSNLFQRDSSNNSNESQPTFSKYYNGNYEEAYKKLLPAAEKGDAVAQVSLGNLYYNGLGVKQSYKDAYYWYKKAADQGYVNGTISIARMYQNGFYLELNTNKAIELYKKAIQKCNSSIANSNLAIIYLKQNNFKKGIAYLKEAAKQGDSGALFQMGLAYYLGLYNLNIDYKKAFDEIEKSANLGDPQGQNNFALLYYEGKATKKNDFEAYKWFYIASNYGNNPKSKELINAYKFNLTDTQKQQAINEAQQWIKTHKEINLNLVGVK